MKRIFAVIELADDSTFEPSDDDNLDDLAEDPLCIAHRVVGGGDLQFFGGPAS